VKAKDFLKLIDGMAPFGLALDWDNSGLQCGDPERPVSRVAVCLDPSPDAVAEAVDGGADLLVAHHPLIFKPVKSLAAGTPQSEALVRAVKADLPVISAHTNWDAFGMCPALADLLEIRPEGFLEPVSAELLKLVCFVPLGSFGDVSEAIFEAGAGQIGAYSRCSFRSEGLGGFLPPRDGDPFIGDPGVYTETAEHRVEAILPLGLRDRVAEAVRASHPYEEPAFEFHRVEATGAYGFGIHGVWDPPRDPLPWIAEKLGTPFLTTAGPVPKQVSRVSILPGSGASYLPLARARGSEVLVTGDLTHHQALLAEELGTGIVAAGHRETELPGCGRLMRELESRAPAAKFFLIGGHNPMPVWRAP
jgi:dinuclear metal center YbgI/SA1388 family protein